MRIMLDTNILISMLFFPSETTKRFKDEVVKHQIILCDYVIREMQLVTERKFPHRREALDYFFAALPFEQVYTPRDIGKGSFPSVRDEKDSPILATAILENVDVFITGDKDFLVLQDMIEQPRIMSMNQFLTDNI